MQVLHLLIPSVFTFVVVSKVTFYKKCTKRTTCCSCKQHGTSTFIQRLTCDQQLSCQSTFVVYLIQCQNQNCRMKYVGQTRRALKKRISEHLRLIRNNDTSALIHPHFNLKCSLDHFRCMPIDKGSSQEDLYDREAFWINTLNTMEPNGLNRRAPKGYTDLGEILYRK